MMAKIRLSELVHCWFESNFPNMDIAIHPTCSREGTLEINGIIYWYRMENYNLEWGPNG